jgi:iron complex transport system ATP-binding protein
MNGVAMQAVGLNAERGGRAVLHDVSLSASSGQWLAVIDPNGAGKSTLLRCLAGLLTPTSGSIHCQPAGAGSVLARARQLSWLGQDPVGDETMTVFDTVALGRLPHRGWLGWSGLSRDDHAAIERALQDTDLIWAAERTLAALSGGERQRVSLARALAVQASVMLLDEPVSHLDAPHQRLVAQVMRREAAQGRCIISVLHELPLALAADRIMVMRQGRVVAEGPRDDAEVHRAIESVFDQAVAITRVNERWVAVPQL